MKKKFIRLILVLGLVSVIGFCFVIGYVIYQLPAAYTWAQTILGPQLKNQIARNYDVQKTDVAQPAPQTPPPTQAAASSTFPPPPPVTVTAATNQQSVAGIDDLINPEKPISNFCRSMKNAVVGSMTPQQFNEALSRSVDVDKADPRAQSLKPVLRYVLQLPEIQNVIQMVITSNEQSADFLQKTDFYMKLYQAYQGLKDRMSEIEYVADQTYLFHKMNSLIALRPDLITEERLSQFCNEIENSINSLKQDNSNILSFDQEKKNFERLLAEFNVNPKDIQYVSDYKSKLEFFVNSKGLQFKGSWLDELFSQPQTESTK